MKTGLWSKEEIATFASLKAQGLTFPQIAEKLGRTVCSVQNKSRYLGNSVLVDDTSTPVGNVEQPEDDPNRVDYWKKQALSLRKDLRVLEEQKTAVEILVEDARSIAPVAYSPAPECNLIQKDTGGGSAQSAFLALSDTHVGQVVTPQQTCGFGGYNFPTFLYRLKRLENSIVSILKDHTTTPVSELVIGMLGDMLHGNLNHAAEAGQLNTVFAQAYNTGHALAQFIRNLSAIVPQVRVYTAVGNHTRWGTQHKMPSVNRYSNLDMFLYAYIEALLRDCPTVKFNLNQQPFTEFNVQGFTFLGAHGEHLRGGDKALGIPAHSLGRNVSIESQLRAKCNRPGVNYYVFGHVHRPMEIPHSQGEIITNGAFPGLDEYAFIEKFVACDPVQKFFLVHPKFGRSACYNLSLKFADTSGPLPYELPENFPIV
jgi:hypothetical protein